MVTGQVVVAAAPGVSQVPAGTSGRHDPPTWRIVRRVEVQIGAPREWTTEGLPGGQTIDLVGHRGTQARECVYPPDASRTHGRRTSRRGPSRAGGGPGR